MGVRDALVLVVSYYVDYDRNLPWLSYRIEGWLLSYQVVHWRANASLLLLHPTIYNFTSIILIISPSQQQQQHNNNNDITINRHFHKKSAKALKEHNTLKQSKIDKRRKKLKQIATDRAARDKMGKHGAFCFCGCRSFGKDI